MEDSVINNGALPTVLSPDPGVKLREFLNSDIDFELILTCTVQCGHLKWSYT